MNINPKKSWHVRNKDNVAKVRRDEEEARLAEVEQARRAALAEQEARTNFLRQKARNKGLGNIETPTTALAESSSEKNVASLNFFSDSSLERGVTSRIKNTDNEKEKKEDQIKFERKIGLLTFLGESAAEGKDNAEQPWYFKAPDRSSRKHKLSAEEKDPETDSKRKSSMDPLQSMKAYVEKKKECISSEEKDKKKKHKRQKHKHRKQEEERIPRNVNKNDKLAKLRDERLKREKKERERAMVLLHGKSNDKNDGYSAPGRYHSQFNPHLVRNRTKH